MLGDSIVSFVKEPVADFGHRPQSDWNSEYHFYWEYHLWWDEIMQPITSTGVLAEACRTPLTSISREYRQLLVNRGCHALYRWYLDRSQRHRNWNPDRGFAWSDIRNDHAENVIALVQGFYAVEQYAPDYTAELTRLARTGYGHSQFQIRWGAEEEKHSDLWRNVLLFTRARTASQLEQYTHDLRDQAWEAPYKSPLEMLFYTVFQERATQLIYLRLAAAAEGRSDESKLSSARDPVLAKVCSAIAADEAAHYDFFLSLARLNLYYFPEESLVALVRVLRSFVMPAATIVPDYDAFIKVLYEAKLFGPQIYGREVARPALKALGIESVKAIEAGLAATRTPPDPSGIVRPPVISGCDFNALEGTVSHLFDRFIKYERDVGLADVDPTVFVQVKW